MNFIKKRKKTFIFLLLFAAFVYLNNTSLFINNDGEEPLLLAHRGMGQTFTMEGITGETCTAERIFKPEHPYLENTLPSMKAAFEAGADVVELDVKLTKDGQFAVFHDWTLECRTNGKGVTTDYTLAELKKLDIGYGYTADNGKTFPFRGKGVGLMPSLEEVFTEFPGHPFLLHIKSNDAQEGVKLAEHLSSLPEKQLSKLAVYGGDKPVASLKKELPDMRVMSMATLKSCMYPYIGTGWTGFMPEACKDTQLHIPEKYAPYMWGWPDKFIQRMEKVNTRVIVVAGDGGWSEGFDSAGDLERLPAEYSGGIWTNRIDRIAPLFK